MSEPEAVHFCDISAVAHRLKQGEISSSELVERMIARVRAVEPRLHSYIRLMEESARRDAETRDKELGAGLYRGTLHGIPIAVKDLIDVENTATGAGMTAFADHRANEDATALRRLRHSGAILLGKLTMSEGAGIRHHPEIPVPINPWNAAYCSGFSSSGSAVAVAAGQCFAALGSDTGGSIRIPSAFNGVTGIKPTWSRVTRHGVFPAAPFLDVIGPMARSAADAAIVLHAIAGRDDADPTSSAVKVPHYSHKLADGIHGIVIGIDWTTIERDCVSAVIEALRNAAVTLTHCGARFRSIIRPHTDIRQLLTLLLARVGGVHRELYRTHGSRYSPAYARLIEDALAIPSSSVAMAIDTMMKLTAEMRSLFDDVDLLLTPVLHSVTPRIGEFEAELENDGNAGMASLENILPFNFSGNPTITFPAGFNAGLPVGVQLVGRHFAELPLLQAAHAFQTASEWHLRRPTL